MKAAALCLIALISLFQVKLGNKRFTTKPNKLINILVVKIVTKERILIFVSKLNAILKIIKAIIDAPILSIILLKTFDNQISLNLRGNIFKIYKFFPSSDKDEEEVQLNKRKNINISGKFLITIALVIGIF